MRNLTLVDWCWAGHVPLHAECISRLFLKHGWGVNHICTEADAAEDYLNRQCDLRVTCHQMPAPPAGPTAKRELMEFRWDALAGVLDVLQTGGLLDYVFFPWIDLQLDRNLTVASVPRQLNVPWGALLQEASDFSPPPEGSLARPRRLKKYQSLHHPALTQLVTREESALRQLKAAFPSADVRWMPDLMEPRADGEGTSAVLETAPASGYVDGHSEEMLDRTFENVLGIHGPGGLSAA